MAEQAKPLSLDGVQTVDDLATSIRHGIERGLNLPYDQFIGVAAKFGTQEGARKIFDACAGIDELSAQGRHEVARDYRRVESWAMALMDGSPQALTRSYVDPLADAKLGTQQGLTDLGGGVIYAGKPDRETLQTLRDEANKIDGAKFFCFRGDGIAVLPLPSLTIESIGDPKVDFDGLVTAGFIYIGDALKGYAFLTTEDQLQAILTKLGAQQSPRS